MPIGSYAELGELIKQVLTTNGEWGGVARAPHKDFWFSLSYEDFTTGNVPGVADGDGNPVRILIPGNSQESALIQVLKGVGIADPNSGFVERMPANGPPWFTEEQISEIADWIDANCPP
jgi:hypothetical protein